MNEIYLKKPALNAIEGVGVTLSETPYSTPISKSGFNKPLFLFPNRSGTQEGHKTKPIISFKTILEPGGQC